MLDETVVILESCQEYTELKVIDTAECYAMRLLITLVEDPKKISSRILGQEFPNTKTL